MPVWSLHGLTFSAFGRVYFNSSRIGGQALHSDGPLKWVAFVRQAERRTACRPMCAILNACVPLKAVLWGIVGLAILSANDRESH
jgi:hypothetical protein